MDIIDHKFVLKKKLNNDVKVVMLVFNLIMCLLLTSFSTLFHCIPHSGQSKPGVTLSAKQVAHQLKQRTWKMEFHHRDYIYKMLVYIIVHEQKMLLHHFYFPLLCYHLSKPKRFRMLLNSTVL